MATQNHILIVDDDAETRSLLQTYLQKHGLSGHERGRRQALREALETRARTSSCSTSCCPARTAWRCAATCARARHLRSSCSPRAAKRPTASSGWRWAPTTTSPSRSTRASCSRASRACCAAHARCPENLRAASAVKSLRFAGWTLDVDDAQPRRARRRRGPLSGAEFRLLRVFLAHPQPRADARPAHRPHASGATPTPFDRAIDVQVSRLRQRLGDDAREPRIIKTVRGEGYVLGGEGRRRGLMRLAAALALQPAGPRCS